MLDMRGFDISLRCETTWTDMGDDSQIHEISGNPHSKSLDDMEEPFIYIEDDKGGHCPYGYSFSDYSGGGCNEFFRDYGRKCNKVLRRKYRESVQQSIRNFQGRIDQLKDRGLLDSTLVIFTSDHGELLGEYGGLVSHGRPPCPELVYVPTVFIHPSIKPKMEKSIIRHVDIYPTICGMMKGSRSPRNTDGMNIFEKQPKVGMSFREGGYFKSRGFLNHFNYIGHSIWDERGGYVFHKHGKYRMMAFLLYKIIKKHPEFIYMINNNKRDPIGKRLVKYKLALHHMTNPEIKYGNPVITKEQAKKIISLYLETKDKKDERLRISVRDTKRKL